MMFPSGIQFQNPTVKLFALKVSSKVKTRVDEANLVSFFNRTLILGFKSVVQFFNLVDE